MGRGACSNGLVVVVVVVTMMLAKCLAQQNCTPTITSLAPCLGFITGNTSTTAPSSACCTQLASIVQTQTQCLCTVLSGAATRLPFVVNQTRALTLPGACKIQTNPLGQCNAGAPGQAPPLAGSPQGAPSPASSPAPSGAINPLPPFTSAPTSPSTPTGPTASISPAASSTPSGDGSKEVPTTSATSSSAKSNTYYTSFLSLLIILVASAFSAF